ncbi:hypothetical protein R6V09_04060 [Streptomyces sp. W16]|uniref:hypothetical protein n=1 Tax=Streptomyces sp. W16 TaxID=3076631 RepID=UPI00295B5F49|nr:hypothetical protein [Streptomyces sp. W16]MDV9169315.1 hypothetical protein [Streptomyces sp. W16]
MAVPVDETVHTHGTGNLRVDAFSAAIPLVHERRPCGAGARGLRSRDWAPAEVTWPGGTEGGPRRGHLHLLPVRRSITYSAVHIRAGAPIGEIVRVMGLRWSIEPCSETAKSDCGLDRHEVRTWEVWHRHITLSMAAPAFLTITDTRSRDLQHPEEPELVRVIAPPPPTIVLAQSDRRRTQQTRAQRCHHNTRDRRDRESRL